MLLTAMLKVIAASAAHARAADDSPFFAYHYRRLRLPFKSTSSRPILSATRLDVKYGSSPRDVTIQNYQNAQY